MKVPTARLMVANWLTEWLVNLLHIHKIKFDYRLRCGHSFASQWEWQMTFNLHWLFRKMLLLPFTIFVFVVLLFSCSQSHTDALTTIQLASRIHRMRRRKHRFPMPSDKTGVGGLAAGVNGGKSLRTMLISTNGVCDNRFEVVFKSCCSSCRT